MHSCECASQSRRRLESTSFAVVFAWFKLFPRNSVILWLSTLDVKYISRKKERERIAVISTTTKQQHWGPYKQVVSSSYCCCLFSFISKFSRIKNQIVVVITSSLLLVRFFLHIFCAILIEHLKLKKKLHRAWGRESTIHAKLVFISFLFHSLFFICLSLSFSEEEKSIEYVSWRHKLIRSWPWSLPPPPCSSPFSVFISLSLARSMFVWIATSKEKRQEKLVLILPSFKID